MPDRHLQRRRQAQACNFAATGRPVCISCSPRAMRPAPAAARTARRPPAGPRAVCDRCDTAALRHQGRCASCGQQRRLVAPPGLAADTCADCAGLPVTHACADCGTEDKLYEKGRCARCSLRRRTRELLSAGTGTIAAELTGVFDAVTAARQPRSALNWLRNGPGPACSPTWPPAGWPSATTPWTPTRTGGPPIPAAHAHRRRGAAAPRRGTRPGRAMAHRGPGDDHPAADRRLVRAYATWQVMRRLRASAAAAARPRTPTAHARNNIRAAASLLAWLRGHGTTLGACGQADVDQWLRTGPSACLAKDFLAWAAARRYGQPLTIPRRRGRPARRSARTSGGRWPPGRCTTPRSTPLTGSPDACSCSTASRCPASPP